ncbi:MAG: hypothetical protein O7B35_05055 [Deltaproteobacteria bacterium]|nr:hypothetical protein [Deltaproteobacteria bacterium]
MGELKLPHINATNRELQQITEEAWSALEKSNSPPHLFRFGDMLCRLEHSDNGEPVARQLTPDRLRYESARSAKWYEKITVNHKTIRKPSKPPVDVIRDMLATPDPPLPKLERIVQVPVFGPDGSLQTEAGYSPSSRTFLSPPKGLTIPEVPTNPTRDDITQARRLFTQHLLVDFPFKSNADLAAAIELILLPFVRDVIQGPTPNHSMEGSDAGAGKGLCSSACLSPAYGPHVGIITQVSSEDEWRKQITALLMQGAGVVKIDNVTDPLSSRSLAAALTEPYWSDRILGISKMVTLPVRCIWVTTATNPVFSPEISRRSIRCRIDPDCQRPWERPAADFKHPDLKKWADEHRAALVRAALTLIQSWIVAGQPLWKERTLGSYEEWAMTMGGILRTAGIKGFLENLDDFYAASDTEGEIWELLVGKWWSRFHQKSVGAGELFPLALESGIEITGNTDQARRVSFGVQLRRHRDQVIGQFKILRSGQVNHAIQWKLEPTHLKEVDVGHGSDGEHDHDRVRGVSINPDNFEKASGQ